MHDGGDTEAAEEEEEAAGAPLVSRWSAYTVQPASRSLLTTEIGSFPRTYDPSTSRVIAGSRLWVCYSVANGHIRVIGATSGKTALLRGHTGKVLDMALREGASSAYLASVSSGGEVFVWSLALQADELVTGALLTGKYTAPGGQHYQRVMWTRSEDGSGLSVLLIGKEAVDLVAVPKDAEGPVELHTANPRRVFAGSVQDAVVDEAGRQLVVADSARTVTRIDLHTNERDSLTQPSTVQRLFYVPPFVNTTAFLVLHLSIDSNRSVLVLLRAATLTTVSTVDLHHPQHHITHLDVDPTGSFLIIAHTNTEASERQHGLLAVHIRRNADDARFDWLSSYKTNFAVLSLSLNNDDTDTVDWDGSTVSNVQLYSASTKPIVQYHINTSSVMRRVEQHELTDERLSDHRLQQSQQQQREDDDSLSAQSSSGLLTPQAIRAASAGNTPASSVAASPILPSNPSITVTAAQTPPSVKILPRPPAINSHVLPTSLGSPSSSPTSSHHAAALLASPSRASPEIPETPASSPATDSLQPPLSSFATHSPGVVTFAALPAAPGQKGGAVSQLAPTSAHKDSPTTSSPTSPTSGTKRRARVLDMDSKEKEKDSGPVLDSDDSKEARRDKQEANLIARLDKLFTRHFSKLTTLQQQTTERAIAAQRDELEKERKERSNVEKQRTEGLLRVVSQSLQKQLDDAVTKGTSTSLQSGTAGGGAVDVEALAASLSQSLRAPLHESFKATFGSVLLPGFEASTRVMFKQIESVYAKMSQSNEQMLAEKVDELVREKLAAGDKRREAETAQLHGTLNQLVASNATLVKTLNVIQQQHQQQSAHIAELKTIIQTLSTATPSSTSAPVSSASAAQPSTAAAAAAASDPKHDISSLLQQHQYEQAFTRALSLGKLALVTWLCSQLDPRILLYTTNPAHKLSPAVLLSLIQQLGFSMKEDAAVKLLWIRECVMVLNRNDATISKHVPAVLRDVLGRVEEELSGTWRDSADRSLFEQGRTVKHLLSAMVGGATSP